MGKAIKVQVTFTDDAGFGETLTSAATAAVAPTNSAATGAPAISGTARVGETLTAGTSGIADGNGLSKATFGYQWLADDAAISGATGSTYTLAATDVGKAVKVRVTFTDDAGFGETLTSAATAAVTPTNSAATGAPAISGTARVGETLTAGTAGIADGNGLSKATFGYQWLADDAAISGATGSTYTLAATDVGKAVKVRVTFTDDAGFGETLTSAATAAVAPTNSAATGAPAISGTARVGETLTAGTAGIADGNGLSKATFGYQWLADDAAISGATGSTYTLAATDVGKAVKVRVTFTDDAGFGETLTSAATAAVAPLPPPAKPSGLSVSTEPGSLDVSVDWNDVEGSGFYWVRWRPVDGTLNEGVEVSSSSATIAVADYGEWVVRAQACNDSGCGQPVAKRFEVESAPEPTPTATPEPEAAAASTAPPPPPAPTNLVVSDNGDGTLTLTWDAPDDDSVTGYQILRRRPQEGEKTLLVYVEDTGSTATTWTDRDVTLGTRHTYRVKAINAAGLSEVSNFDRADPAPPEENSPASE